MKLVRKYFAIVLLVASTQLLAVAQSLAAPVEEAPKSARCTVCGMFVAKYATWITQIHHTNGDVEYFDGVKDMLVYYNNPQNYGGKRRDSFTEIWVKDYYSLNWLDARKAFYVIGSDVKGPMGPEFIPFSSNGAAETFLKDHQGERIITFDEITLELVESMRHGHKMKMTH